MRPEIDVVRQLQDEASRLVPESRPSTRQLREAVSLGLPYADLSRRTGLQIYRMLVRGMSRHVGRIAQPEARAPLLPPVRPPAIHSMNRIELTDRIRRSMPRGNRPTSEFIERMLDMGVKPSDLWGVTKSRAEFALDAVSREDMLRNASAIRMLQTDGVKEELEWPATLQEVSDYFAQSYEGWTAEIENRDGIHRGTIRQIDPVPRNDSELVPVLVLSTPDSRRLRVRASMLRTLQKPE